MKMKSDQYQMKILIETMAINQNEENNEIMKKQKHGRKR